MQQKSYNQQKIKLERPSSARKQPPRRACPLIFCTEMRAAHSTPVAVLSFLWYTKNIDQIFLCLGR